MLKGMSPQQALDAGRFCIDADVTVGPFEAVEDINGDHGQPSRISRNVDIEDAVDPQVIKTLKEMGHQVRVLSNMGREKLGRGQIIQKLQAKVKHIDTIHLLPFPSKADIYKFPTGWKSGLGLRI